MVSNRSNFSHDHSTSIYVKLGENKLYHDKDRYIYIYIRKTVYSAHTKHRVINMHHRDHTYTHAHIRLMEHISSRHYHEFSIERINFPFENLETTDKIDVPNFPFVKHGIYVYIFDYLNPIFLFFYHPLYHPVNFVQYR